MAHQIKGELSEVVKDDSVRAEQEKAKAEALAASFRRAWMLQ